MKKTGYAFIAGGLILIKINENTLLSVHLRALKNILAKATPLGHYRGSKNAILSLARFQIDNKVCVKHASLWTGNYRIMKKHPQLLQLHLSSR